VHWRRERTALYLYQAQTKRKAKTTEVKDETAMAAAKAPATGAFLGSSHSRPGSPSLDSPWQSRC